MASVLHAHFLALTPGHITVMLSYVFGLILFLLLQHLSALKEKRRSNSHESSSNSTSSALSDSLSLMRSQQLLSPSYGRTLGHKVSTTVAAPSKTERGWNLTDQRGLFDLDITQNANQTKYPNMLRTLPG